MRQSAVRRVQPPGGVRDRVKAWQKANAAVKVAPTPDDAATEPTDVAFDGEEGFEDVTEEDRIRIKMRKKKKKPPVVEYKVPDETPASSEGTPAPKKRVVSDEHWKKVRERKSPPRKRSPVRKISPRRLSPKRSPAGAQIPKNFTLQTAAGANVSNRVKAWADKVEVPDTPPPRSHRSGKSGARSIISDVDFSDIRSEDATSAKSHGTVRLSLRHKRNGSVPADGIRVKPVRAKKQDDDGIRITPMNSAVDSDSEIKVESELSTELTESTGLSRSRSKTLPSSPRPPMSALDRIEVIEEPSELSQSTGQDFIEVIEDMESALSVPAKARGKGQARQRSQNHSSKTQKQEMDDESALSPSQLLGSDLSHKSLADIPGEIPWGHSAFSELDLPLNGPARSRPKQPKAPERTASLNVFKKVMQEGKKIISEMNEPPRPTAANRPPNIENWLHDTVDPFVEDKENKTSAVEEPVKEPKTKDRTPEPMPQPVPDQSSSQPTPEAKRKPRTDRKSSHDTGTSGHSRTKSESMRSEDTSLPSTSLNDVTPKSKTSSDGLKRRSAIRNSSTPTKQAKRPLLGMLKDAFSGESVQRIPSFNYQGQEERRFEDDEYDDDGMTEDRTMSGYETRSSYLYDETPTTSELSQESTEQAPRMAGPRLRPPTNGNYELSTIMSEESSSAMESDMTSDVSPSTLTQSTVLTKDSNLSRDRSKNVATPGLKRRLTKHSDLVSVLSLPDDRSIPDSIKRSRPSLRKVRGHSDQVTPNELLREFSDDEGLYMRELKTLVDGVVPVLLSQVVNDVKTADIFDQSTQKLDGLSAAVVGMGIALEKLRNAHKKAPHHDLRRMAHWAHGVVPIYNNYLKSWRLGFQDLIVNLAPAAGVPEDEDSLLNAMPRNEHGDVLNEDGERVDVAHLLKRPLIRIKHMVKLIKCVDSIMPSEDTHELLKNFEELQSKSRRRYREETARLTDEEAARTDTTRARDLRTLGALDYIEIDQSLQVNAKDVFSLDLAHSNGQRLECQVELVHRDNQQSAGDKGDLLIRETGDHGRAYLLFPPVLMGNLSARTGEGNNDMVLMVRGMHHGKPWHELLTLTSDSEDQILDWLDILPLSPVPPREPEPSVVGEDEEEERKAVDIPFGARSIRRKGGRYGDAGPTTPTRSPSSRQQRRRSGVTTTPPRIDEEENEETTPTQNDYRHRPRSRGHDRSRPLHEGMRPDPLTLRKHEDAPPMVPIHRTLSPLPLGESDGKKASIKPPAELKKQGDGQIKRRGSSPLKHEYLPSDEASRSGVSRSSHSEDDYTEYSDGSVSELDSDEDEDELERIDVPQTELGVSIQEAAPIESDLSLTPSNSASQAGLHRVRDEIPAEPRAEAPVDQVQRFMASISQWSDSGVWRDVTTAPCAIVVRGGMIEAYPFQAVGPGENPENARPMLALDLTPLVLIRHSTVIDVEIRSAMLDHCTMWKNESSGGNFRFRCHSGPDCFSFYMAVHHARLRNQKFIQLETENRFRSFGQNQAPATNDGDASSRRRSLFGRKNSYRSSIRAPPQSFDGASTTPSSNASAKSFLKRLSAAGNLTFNLGRSSVDKQSRPGSVRNSLYSSSSASNTPPRSPSISVENSGHNIPGNFNAENIRIRLHLLASATKWEDYGNCSLQIRRPPPGWHQALRANHGLEKRVTVTTLPRKESDAPKIMLDAVLGSGCFTQMGSRGIVCGVWEEVRDQDGLVGGVPATGATGGNIKKWCFQCASAPEAAWVLRLVHQEVIRV
ncbi:uncharacterized protein F5Z01DRAFT_666410 [Emericellopsis atlantica]|uniref:SRm160/300 splicing coactivator n=1 Tax=Emericellopsis atlantica TaxID=2614577 RepID=A0A9P8CKV0_9HYPO|nr:uncharacterized protein F5Z01DRAFT_666410 [Emericellopsis atlantica]KAG9250422.1 hypothetical protein F5Z01DRAFT_666410 [Emericellopsis atlantica]